MKPTQFILFLILSSAVYNLKGQVNFITRAPEEVSVNEQFTVVFTVNAEAEDFQAPSFEGFRILMGPSPSYSRQQINRQVFYNNSFSYLLLAKEPGTFTIGPASVEVKGEVYRSNSVTVKVVPGSSRDPNSPYSLADKNADLRVLLSKSTVYQGEPIIASYKIYFKSRVGNYNLLSEPEFTGFYTEKVNMPLRRIETERISGEMMNTAVLEQRVIIPQQTGKIKPGKVEMLLPTMVSVNRRNSFGNSFRIQEMVELNLQAQVPEINVIPLPSKGQPENFGGAVGSFKMNVSLSRDNLAANESATLKIKIEGRGNVKLLEIPKPEFPNVFEVYDPKVQESINISEVGMSGSKTAEYLLVPRYGGDYKIPPFSFSYFDPVTKTYKTHTSEEYIVSVEGEAKPKGGLSNEGEKIELINSDILFIKTETDLYKRGGRFFGSNRFYIFLGILILLPLIIFLFYYQVKKKQPDKVKLRTGMAGKVARKHLHEARKKLEAGEHEEFYLALTTALWGYFADRFNISQSRLSKETIKDELLAHSIDESLIAQTLDVMNRAELARFTSSGVSNPKADYAETARIITEIENQL